MTTVCSVVVVYNTARGKPIPTVQWYKDGVAFNPLPKPFQQALIVSTHIPHTTVYTCVGISHAGKKMLEVFANITIIVKGKTAAHNYVCLLLILFGYHNFTALPSISRPRPIMPA